MQRLWWSRRADVVCYVEKVTPNFIAMTICHKSQILDNIYWSTNITTAVTAIYRVVCSLYFISNIVLLQCNSAKMVNTFLIPHLLHLIFLNSSMVLLKWICLSFPLLLCFHIWQCCTLDLSISYMYINIVIIIKCKHVESRICLFVDFLFLNIIICSHICPYLQYIYLCSRIYL